jgi:hypothetical protein
LFRKAIDRRRQSLELLGDQGIIHVVLCGNGVAAQTEADHQYAKEDSR